MQIILTIIIAACIYVFFDLFFSEEKERVKKEKTKITYQSLSEMIEEKATKTTKEERDKIFINNLTKSNQSLKYKVRKKILDNINSEYNSISLTMYIILSALSALIGIYVSRVFNNSFVTMMIAFGFMSMPYILISHNNNKKRLEKDNKLQMVMGNLSTTYIRSKSFLEAVESNIDIIPHPIKTDFVYFIRAVKYLKADKVEAMIELRDKVNNSYFSKFMNLVINSELGEHNLKYTILSIPQDYKRYIDINNNFLREVREHNKNFIILLASFPLVLGLIRGMSKYYFYILTETTVGKITISIIIVILAIISILFIRINKPVKIKM